MPSETPARYEEWLEFFFGRFEQDSSDPWAMNWEFDAKAPEIADLFVATLERSGTDLHRYSDAQVSIGLQALLFMSFGSVGHVLTGAGPTEEQRLAVLRSFRPLYLDCLAHRSPPVLGHLSETQNNPLEFLTYMLWDGNPYDFMEMCIRDRCASTRKRASRARRRARTSSAPLFDSGGYSAGSSSRFR